ncbi:hypothetical protein [Halobacterium jilantaiense]|uniref:Uncharacterized protein n=1 Tax=Halobacterium jilantaiense TaxID=355548 RepID=A0A1I0Q7Q2_9EURY|nr:hypothetical protein [Halobacterium jilantaiense]SEW22858.1 hypothetical protein SAMN04487945_2349 [Halobacterium jilantaiense]
MTGDDPTHSGTIDWPAFWADADDEDRESTLSDDAMHSALGTWPRSFWEVVEKPEQRWAWRNHPLVWVPEA